MRVDTLVFGQIHATNKKILRYKMRFDQWREKENHPIMRYFSSEFVHKQLIYFQSTHTTTSWKIQH